MQSAAAWAMPNPPLLYLSAATVTRSSHHRTRLQAQYRRAKCGAAEAGWARSRCVRGES